MGVDLKLLPFDCIDWEKAAAFFADGLFSHRLSRNDIPFQELKQ